MMWFSPSIWADFSSALSYWWAISYQPINASPYPERSSQTRAERIIAVGGGKSADYALYAPRTAIF